MEDNEDEPDDVRKATPVEEEITRGEIDEHSGGTSMPVKLARRRHRCEKDNPKKLKTSSLKSKEECCRAKLEKAARAPKTAKVLIYEKECTLPKVKTIPRHCLTKEELIDILATPSRKCPSPCLRREVTKKIRPVSTRINELAQPPKNRLLNTLQDRAGTLPTELVDHLIQRIEGEACLTPEQAEQIFRDKDNRARKKHRKKKSKLNSREKKSNKQDERRYSSNVSAFDKEAVNYQYLMAESFVKSILEWKTPIPKEEFKDIAQVILKRLGYVLEHNPVDDDDRKSQQMRFLADIVASWISGVLFDVAEARRAELEEECERKRREMEEESEEDSDDESIEESDKDDDDDDEGKDERKKKGGSPPRKRKDDKDKKGRKDGRDDDDDKKGGKPAGKKEDKKEDKDLVDDGRPEMEDAEDTLKEDGEKEPTGENLEEDELKSAMKDQDVTGIQGKEGVSLEEEVYHDTTVESGQNAAKKKTNSEVTKEFKADKSKDKITGEQLIPIETEDGKMEDSQNQKYQDFDKGDKTDERIEPVYVANLEIQIGQQRDDTTLKITDEAKQGTTDEPSGIAVDKVEDKNVDISESLVKSKPTEAAQIAVDEKIVPEKAPVESAEKLVALEVEKVVGDDEETPKSGETDERAAGDKKGDTKLPLEQTTTPDTSEISETKQKKLDVDDSGDTDKTTQEDTILAAASDDTAVNLEIEKEKPMESVVKLPEAKDIIETSKRKPSKIPSSIVSVKRRKFQTDAPFVTFDKIFHTIYNAIEKSDENPGNDAITNRLHRAVYEKCSNVVQEEKPEPLTELTKDVLDVLAGKIALWLRDIITESQLSFMNKFPATVESVDVREWTKWIGYVSETANTWSTWIQKTIRHTEAMRSGKITRGDWLDWTKSVDEDALLWRRFYLESCHQAHQNLTMIRDRRVVKTGTRDLTDGDYEREMKITDLELEKSD